MAVKVDRVDFYKDRKKQWRWKRTAPNGPIVGASTEAYKRRTDAIRNFRRQQWGAEWEFKPGYIQVI
jgi:hypothetical protein